MVEPIDSVPIQDVLPKPKRGPGRPRKDGLPPGSVKPTRKPTRRKAPTRPRTRSLKPEIASFLTLANQLILMSPIGTRPIVATVDPTIPVERVGDELDAAEIAALAAALDAQAQRSPRFRKYLERVLGVGASGQLVGVLGIIATRRAARHGFAPPLLDPLLGAQLAGGTLDTLGDFVGVETRDDPADDADAATGETPPDRAVDFEMMGMEP